MEFSQVIQLIEMMEKNNSLGWEDGTKLKHDSYMKGKADALKETLVLIQQLKERYDEN